MTGLAIIVAVTALIGFILWWFDRRGRQKEESGTQEEGLQKETETEAAQEPAQGECCGMHIVCEKDSLMPHSTEIEYYDDEELDRFAGRQATDYDESEIEEWRDILLTLRPEEIAGWARSIQLRRIEMPSPIRDELLLIVSEARTNRE